MHFFKHPSKVCMTYFHHAKLSFKFSYMFLKASHKALIHAIIPDVYITSTSDSVDEISKLLKESGCIKENN